ncbi:hypothetical protein [Streptomyces sp. TS71-3]|uniref:hypothetical protein n=1 Tax=Streptomyces sp. TS71-3 TaxID=2733862 RepID=UPI001B206306|nr:hypothetical protein [Streptomyces sp. TS71-3]GHJ34545.1 hypothetical protein Sm713_01540 [Streptomyces sp. TS71-3]
MGGLDEVGRDDAVRTAEPAGAAHDRHWAGGLRSALLCPALLLGLLLLVDRGIGDLTWWRAGVWTALAVLLFLVLFPARVTAGPGWLASRGLLHGRLVRTDRLRSVRWSDGISQRVVLRDALGGRVDVDARVLAANPHLWHRLSEDARTARELGFLVSGEAALRRLSERIDREAAADVFKVSGLE